MEKLGSWKLKINAKEMMTVAEKLYQRGYISYPRTETNIFPPELDLNALVQALAPDNRWSRFAENILNTGGARPRNGKKSDKAHPPIHPLKLGNDLQGTEARVFEFIARYFLACCSRDAKGMETVVEIDVGGEMVSVVVQFCVHVQTVDCGYWGHK
jgi:DNA topoisomerase-3